MSLNGKLTYFFYDCGHSFLSVFFVFLFKRRQIVLQILSRFDFLADQFEQVGNDQQKDVPHIFLPFILIDSKCLLKIAEKFKREGNCFFDLLSLVWLRHFQKSLLKALCIFFLHLEDLQHYGDVEIDSKWAILSLFNELDEFVEIFFIL